MRENAAQVRPLNGGLKRELLEEIGVAFSMLGWFRFLRIFVD
jgi:hypothetical protein